MIGQTRFIVNNFRTGGSTPLNLGVSLMFYEKKETTGVLKSYVFGIPELTVDGVKKGALIKAKDQIHSSFPNYKYLGIQDLYLIVGSKAEKNLLGIITYYEYNKKSLAKSLLRKDADHSFYGEELKNRVRFYNANLVFFYRDIPSSDSFAFVVITVVKSVRYNDAKNQSKALASSNSFMRKILAGSSQKLDINNIQFLGFNDYLSQQQM